MIDLKGKKILVTGASSGIGRATAILCDQLGAEIILTGRNKEELSATQKTLANPSGTFIADLSTEAGVNELLAQVPNIDGMVHCAGIVKPIPVKYIKQKNIEEIFGINFNSAVLLSAGLLQLKKVNPAASFVFISSISSEFPYPGSALYSASKSALEAFARTFALENAAKKIRANVLSPALVKTEIWKEISASLSAEELKNVEHQYPLGIGEPADIANAAAFLLSDASRWITGTTIKMDGGLLLKNS